MSSHIHLFAPGQNVTCDTSADVIGGRLVEVVGNRSVAHAAAASVKVLGAAATDTKAGDDVLVLRGGVQNLLSSGVIAPGNRVIAAADGKVASAGNGVAGIGLALTTATAADQPIQIALD